MGYIENCSEFKNYMEKFGPPKEASRLTYITSLNFISDNGFKIDTNISDNETILNFLRINENKRENYKSEHTYSDLKSVLNKYRDFVSSGFTSVISDFEDIEKQEIPETEKDELRKARIGQGKYRRELIKLWKKCAVSELSRTELLIASHILPWRIANNEQRLDKYNGLLLLPNYDKLFDSGYISFENDGQIILSPKISIKEYKSLVINNGDKLFHVFPENIKYLEHHRKNYEEQLFFK